MSVRFNGSGDYSVNALYFGNAILQSNYQLSN